jgi:hypothetical protein
MEVQILKTAQFVKCQECQKSILILPDIKAMSRAFNEHAKEHAISKYKRTQIINNLTQQLLIQLIKTDNTTPKPELFLLIETYYGVKKVRGIALNTSDADRWVKAQQTQDPQGSYFYEKGTIYTGEA